MPAIGAELPPLRSSAAEAEAGLHQLAQGQSARLNALSDEAFLGLRASGAPAIAYAQLLSTGQLGAFQTLAPVKARRAQSQAQQQSVFDNSSAVPREDDDTFDLTRL